MAVDMHDYKYVDLVTKKAEWDEWMTTIQRVRSPSLQRVAEAFGANLERIAMFEVMPAEIAAKVLWEQHLLDYALFEVTGKIAPTVIEQFRNRELKAEQFQEVFKREAKKHSDSETPERHYEFLSKYGVGYIGQALRQAQGMRDSMDAILSSVVIESWTAFESLAGDLWAVGVNKFR